jgi:hypothetical protein
VIHVSTHAIQRYQERVENVSADEVRERLCRPAIAKAVQFGARYIRLGSGHRLVILNQTVVTVLPVHIGLRTLDWSPVHA